MPRHGGTTVWGAYLFSIVGHPAVRVTLSVVTTATATQCYTKTAQRMGE